MKSFVINFNSQKYSKGQIIPLKIDDNGVPLDRFWRNRLKEGSIKLLKIENVHDNEDKETLDEQPDKISSIAIKVKKSKHTSKISKGEDNDYKD